jgi:hypothetical protein
MTNRVLPLLCFLACPLSAAEVDGRVTDAVSGEALARVMVSIHGATARTTTGPDGRFTLPDVEPGEAILVASLVGYLPARQTFTVKAGETQSFDISLSPATLRQSVSVVAAAGPFEQEAPLAASLTGEELKNLASVLADDPLRAVQTMPGVTSNDDFKSEFAIRGAGFERIGLYLDGILLHQPFHTVQSTSNTASLTAVSSDTLGSLTLYSGPLPPMFADRTAGALDLDTRDGNRKRIHGRAEASASSAGGEAEGPLGSTGRGSWLVSARKSYLQYIISRIAPNNDALAFGYTDVQGRATYDLTPHNNITIAAVQGFSGLDRSGAKVGVNAIFFSNYKTTTADFAWRYTPSASFLVTNRFAYIRERFFVDNRDHNPLGGGAYGEWVWNADSHAVWATKQQFQFGSSIRRLRDDSFANVFFSTPVLTAINRARGTALRSGAYAQQAWSLVNGRLSGTVGARWDIMSTNGVQAVSPYVSIALQLLSRTKIEAAWGQAVQYPTIPQLTSFGGRTSLLPERASQTQLVLEQRLDTRTRLRFQLYNRQDRDLLFQPFAEPRQTLAGYSDIHPNAPWQNSQRGYARGVEGILQRRTANGFTGWVSYSYGVARVHDGFIRRQFYADWDQRHSVNVYGSYRLRPTVNFSSRWVYGSGIPIPGFIRYDGTSYYITFNRNRTRIPDYQRLDFRVNKVWVHDHWQLNLFAEVANILNRDNRRYEAFNGFNPQTGVARLGINSMLPILPTAGLVVQF